MRAFKGLRVYFKQLMSHCEKRFIVSVTVSTVSSSGSSSAILKHLTILSSIYQFIRYSIYQCTHLLIVHLSSHESTLREAVENSSDDATKQADMHINLFCRVDYTNDRAITDSLYVCPFVFLCVCPSCSSVCPSVYLSV